MKKTEIHNRLEEILSLKSYGELSTFSDPEKWKEMSKPERELLGNLFIMHGSELALKGSQDAIRCLRLAAKAAPTSAHVFFKIGEAYVGMGQNPKILKAACRSFAKAVNLNPEYYEAWAAYALTETLCGELSRDVEGLMQADRKYQTAYDLLLKNDQVNPSSLCWRWGGLWYRIARISGEPSDYHEAIKKFTLAKEAGIDEPDFLNDFGNLVAEQASLTGSIELFMKAAAEYEECILKNPKHTSAYLNLGCANMRLFEATGELEYYTRGDQAFRASSDIDPHQGVLWLFWGMLELMLAKRKQGPVDEKEEMFLSAMKKFEVADLCDPNHPAILLRWGEALMCLGGLVESCEHLKEGLEKIKKCIQKDPERTEAWYFHGRILAELGRYFQDERILTEAKEKYLAGLKLDPHFTAFHYGLGLVSLELFEATAEVEPLEDALEHLKEVAATPAALPPQFWLDMGVAHLRLGEVTKDVDEVRESLLAIEKALEPFEGRKPTPLLLDILCHYAMAKTAYGDLTDDPQHVEAAAKIFNQILQEDKSFESVRFHYALALQHLGEMVADADILRESIHQYEEAIKEDPEDDMAWNGLGVSLISLSEMVDDPMHQDEVEAMRHLAETKLLAAASLGCLESYYSLACLFSISENLHASMYYLEKARQQGSLPPLDDMMHDEWLTKTRASDEFRSFIRLLHRDGEE
ncbi:tetratricopeptide repeat protein [Estrella lausannensis]|uniref:TPR repeat-containing protein n=1 Tax=Estrella lausannensis TaxID=483423 RepID=A0A0H5E783_9BACT|nr:hypothetical protein [Estrella lausannensis]CRX39180.1 Conserved hypothetical protein [Estrella lausannensis]